MNTEFLKKEGSLGKHANKIVHGANLSLIGLMAIYFPTKEQYNEHCRQCVRDSDRQEQRISETWQATMDNRIAIARLGHGYEFDSTNNIAQTTKGN